jgi:hypothetical protein
MIINTNYTYYFVDDDTAGTSNQPSSNYYYSDGDVIFNLTQRQTCPRAFVFVFEFEDLDIFCLRSAEHLFFESYWNSFLWVPSINYNDSC